MSAMSGTKGWLVLTGVAALLCLAVVPAFAGTASASPAPASTVDPSNQWAYGGVGYSNNTVIVGDQVLTWNASFGWTVIFTVTPTLPNTTLVEEQRTVGVDLTAKYSSPSETATYSFHADESDLAFANLTNASTVYENGVPVPALGIINDSTAITGAIAEQLSLTDKSGTKSASLDVNAKANVLASFTPALGLIPLNLSGATEWNSTAWINPSGTWNITWAWANNGFGGVTGSGSGGANGTSGVAGQVNLTGYDVTKTYGVPVFPDHKTRHAILLVIEGPLGNYDAFVLTPRLFDLFGGSAHGYDSDALGTASISSETLYVSQGSFGPTPTAGATTFGATTSAVSSLQISGVSQASPAASSSADPGATVVGGPMSVSAAQAESNCLTNGCGAGPAGTSLGLLVLGVGIAVVATVGTVTVVEWRSYARRRAQKGLVGGYAEAWPNGVPPAGGPAAASPPSGQAPASPSGPELPPRQF
ncbi:MAG TPA: hypothetical protein VEL82_02265 [Thermoplasmata archaeon]|nr:hypothetical protein [Thermoplasmata archaeon]